MDLNVGVWMWVFLGLSSIAGVIGIFIFFYFERMHPKQRFMIRTAAGYQMKALRLYGHEIPTELDIITLLFGKRPRGFRLQYFNYEFISQPHPIPFFPPTLAKTYVGEYIQGHLFPIPFDAGTTQFVMRRCSKCQFSDRLTTLDAPNCPKCQGAWEEVPIILSNEDLQLLKYSPDSEQRQIFTMQTLEKRGRLPLFEYIAIADVGKRALEMMDNTTSETKTVLDSNNPFITALIAALPLSITLILFAFGVFVMWQALGDSLTKGSEQMALASQNLIEVAQMLKEMKGG